MIQAFNPNIKNEMNYELISLLLYDSGNLDYRKRSVTPSNLSKVGVGGWGLGDAQIITLLNFDMGSGSGIDSYLPIIFSYILLDSFDANLNEIISFSTNQSTRC